MSYSSWFDAHATKHKKIVDKLVAKGYDTQEIINYFDFDNMVKEEFDFCPLYKDNKTQNTVNKAFMEIKYIKIVLGV